MQTVGSQMPGDASSYFMSKESDRRLGVTTVTPNPELDAMEARLARYVDSATSNFFARINTAVVPTTVTLPPSSSTSTPSTGTSPLTIAAIGFGVLKLLAII